MRILVAILAIITLSACSEPVKDQYTNKLVSCSVNLPQDWRDALTANEVKAAPANAVKVVATSADGRTTIVQTWSSVLELALHTPDKQRRPIIATRDYLHVIEFDGRRVKFAVQKAGQIATFHTWDAETGAPPVQVDGKFPEPERDRSSDGTTTVWKQQPHRLVAHRADWPRQRLVAEIQDNWQKVGAIWNPQVHGDFVSWTAMDSSYVTDLRTSATVHTAPGYSLTIVGGALVMFGKTVASATPLSELSSLPAC